MASNALDMALDDVITQNRSDKRRTNNRGGNRGGINKSNRGGSFRSGNNYSRQPYGSRPSTRSGNNQQSSNNYQQPRISRNNLVVSNLHYNVTENDLYELFGQMGQLKRAFLHLAPSGGSAGVADIVFSNPNDAERALTSYNNVELDGRPMRISFAAQTVAAPQQHSSGGGPTRRPMRGSGGNRGGNKGGRGGRGGNRRQNNRPRPSEADLDADMDSYMATPNEDA